MNIVFVAGGLGTRFNELSVFPKILLPTASYDSLLNETISKFDSKNDFYLIINNKYYDMVENYINVNHTKELLGLNSLTLIGTSVCNGSLSSLSDVEDKLPNENILFVWSDIIVPSGLEQDIKNTNILYGGCIGYKGIVFVSKDGKYRYNFDGEYIQQVTNYDGNIPGVYYFVNKPRFNEWYTELGKVDNCDLVDLIRAQLLTGQSIYSKNELESIIEYKDLETYKELLKNHKVNLSQTRFFNKIDIDKENKKVTKQAINSDYVHIIKDEINWYQYIIQQIGNGVISPKIDLIQPIEHWFVMDYLDGYIPLHIWNDNATEEQLVLAYSNIKKNLDILAEHTKEVSIEDFIQDLEKEMKTKVIDRCDKISHMLINYDKEYLITVLDKVMSTILEQYKGQSTVTYTLCHGDLNGSNVMVNKTNGDVKFIDPRGYFGFTKMYGWDIYEKSKLLYGLMGYDDFNLNPQIYLTDEPKNHKYVNSIEYLNKPIYKLVVGIIYVALAGYISQDIMKANIAYEYGLKLIDDYYG